jgi:hypothetical protein
MLACFPFGMEDTLGKAEVSVVDTVTKNIESFVEACPPKLPDNARFAAARQWQAENAHISHFGMIEWAVRREQGHAGAGPTISRDTAVGGGVRKFPLVRRILTSLGNVTRSVHALFGAVDKEFRNSYAAEFMKIPIAYRHYFSTDMPEAKNKRSVPRDSDIFSYRALLVNLWTRPHRDINDWKEGWAWIVPFGDFSGGDFCVTELRRRIPFPAGAVLGLRGGALEHWTTRWTGNSRYSLVHTFHEYVRDWNWTGESSDDPPEKEGSSVSSPGFPSAAAVTSA